MPKAGKESFQCQVCKQKKKQSEVLPGSFVRNPIVVKIQQTVPDWSPEGYICLADLNRFRAEYVQSVIEEDKGQLSTLEEQVVESLKEEELISKNLNLEYEQQLTLGQRMADKIADFGGSWQFIGIFGVVLVLWMSLNSIQFITKPFDPYPFIFLNLILSCLAAIQAPIIMMSQNRQEERDRIHAEYDSFYTPLSLRRFHMIPPFGKGGGEGGFYNESLTL
jgi:Protein of unknown function (DUF1003)